MCIFKVEVFELVSQRLIMGLLDGLLNQLKSFREVGNTNPRNVSSASTPADVYSGDVEAYDDSGDDSDSSVDLEEPLRRIARRAPAPLPPAPVVVSEGFFTEAELNAFEAKAKEFYEGIDSSRNRANPLLPYTNKAERIFARYGGSDFVWNTFMNGLRGVFPHGGQAEFEEYKQQALGNKPLDVPAPPPVSGSGAILSAAQTDEEDLSTEDDSSEERKRRLDDLARVVAALPSNWNGDGAEGGMTKWQKYAWILSESRNDVKYVHRHILGDLWDKNNSPREFREMDERMAETRENLSTTQWQAAGQNGRVLDEGRAAGDLVSKFRPGMVWSDGINEFRLISMFHDPGKPREVMFLHTSRRADWQGSSVWMGSLDKNIHAAGEREYGSERINFEPYTSYNPERPFPVDFQSTLSPSTRFRPFVYANNKGFHGQLRFNVGDRYFCPEWDDDGYEGEIVSFEIYSLVKIEENNYAVFKKDGEDTEISALIQISQGETSDVTLIPGVESLEIEYAMLDIDDVDEEDRTIYATYTHNIKESVEELQAYEQEMRQRRDEVRQRNAAREARTRFAVRGTSYNTSDGTSDDGTSSDDDSDGGLGSGDDVAPVAAASSASVLMAEDMKWWRVDTNKANIDDRIEVGMTAPTRAPKNLEGQVMARKKPWKWLQWESAAITFAGVAESDSSGLATETAKRNPLSFEDCQKLRNKFPGAILKIIPMDGDRKACVVYLPKFFDSGDVKQADMVQEMQRVKPQYIDRHTQNRGPTKTNHKNKRWNTNIVDKIHARPDGVYARDKRRAEAAKAKFAETGVKEDKYIPKLTSSEIPFAQLPAFTKAREKIAALGESALPEESREPYGIQKRNLTNLNCELNFYFGDPLPAGGIGFHGDEERNLVFGGSIGSKPRYIEWCRFLNAKPYKDPADGKFYVYRMRLNPGDAYIMSEWAAGITWKDKKNVTIRHRAGSRAFLYKDSASKVKVDGGRGVFTKNYETGEDVNNFQTIDITGTPAAAAPAPAVREPPDSDDDSDDDSSGANFTLEFVLENPIDDQTGGDNALTGVNPDSGARQRTAYYDKRKSGSEKPLSRFRVGETIEGKGRRGAKATLTITKRGTRTGSADEYLNVDVTDARKQLLQRVQYKIRMDPKGYPYWRTNTDYAFEVATLVGGKNKNCPTGISAWNQACPLGYENGVTYRTDLVSGVFFVVNGRTSSGNLIVRQDASEIELEVIQQSSERNPNLRWEELLVPDPHDLDRLDDLPQGVYAEEPPICKEEYDATTRRAERSAAAASAAAAPRASRASRGKFTLEEFGRYKELVEQEDLTTNNDNMTLDDEAKADLHQFRARAEKLLQLKQIQMLLESNFSKSKEDFENDMREIAQGLTEPREELYFYFKNLQGMLDAAAFEAVKKELGVSDSYLNYLKEDLEEDY